MTRPPANLSHCHVDYETGFILHVDPVTGEVLVRKKTSYLKSPDAEYESWAAKRRACMHLIADHAAAQANLMKMMSRRSTLNDTQPVMQRRGRPKSVSKNPVDVLMPFLMIPAPLPGIADIIDGSICTSAGISNGKLNVSVRAVIGALYLSEISAEACQTGECSPRTAQRIAKVARHAAHGISSYLERHPKLRARLEAELGVEAAFRVRPN